MRDSHQIVGAISHFGGDVYVAEGVDEDDVHYRIFFDAKLIHSFEINFQPEAPGALTEKDLEELLAKS